MSKKQSAKRPRSMPGEASTMSKEDELNELLRIKLEEVEQIRLQLMSSKASSRESSSRSASESEQPGQLSVRRTSDGPKAQKETKSRPSKNNEPASSGIASLGPGSSPGTSKSREVLSQQREDCDDTDSRKEKTARMPRPKKNSQSSHGEEAKPLLLQNTAGAVPETLGLKKLAPEKEKSQEKLGLKRPGKKRSQSSLGGSIEDLPLARVLGMMSDAVSSSGTSQSLKLDKNTGNDSFKEKPSSRSKGKKRSQSSLQDLSSLVDHTISNVNSIDLPLASASETVEAVKSELCKSMHVNRSPSSEQKKDDHSVKEKIVTGHSQFSVQETQEPAMDKTKKTTYKRKMKDLSPRSNGGDMTESSVITPPRKRRSSSVHGSPNKEISTSSHDNLLLPENLQSILPHSGVRATCSDMNNGVRTPPFLILTRLSTDVVPKVPPSKEQSTDLIAISSPISKVVKKSDKLSRPMPKSCKMRLEKTLVASSDKVDPPLKPFSENAGFVVPALPPLKPKISKPVVKPSSSRSLPSKGKSGSNVPVKHKGNPSTLQSSTNVPSKPSFLAEPSVPSDMFRNFHKPKAQIEPLEKLQIENEELDFEPGTNDDDDLLSIYADTTIFRIGEDRGLEETAPRTVSATAPDTCDVDSLASYGSDDSRRLSDMEEDSDDEGNFKRKSTLNEDYESEGGVSHSSAPIEMGFPVEDYTADSMVGNLEDMEQHMELYQDSNNSCISMSIASTDSPQNFEAQESCPIETAVNEGDDTITGNSRSSCMKQSLISGGFTVSQSNVLNEELSPTRESEDLGVTPQETEDPVCSDKFTNKSIGVEPDQENDSDEPNLPATAEHSSNDVEQIMVPHPFVHADKQSSDSDGNNKITLDHSTNTDVVFEKQKEMCRREMEEDIRLISEVPTDHAGVHFSPPRRVYPDHERRGLLPTPNATSARALDIIGTVDHEPGANLPPSQVTDRRSFQYSNRERPPLLPVPTVISSHLVGHERRGNFVASDNPKWPVTCEGERNLNAPPLLYDPTDGPPRPYPSMSTSLVEAAPTLNVITHKNVERSQPSNPYQALSCPISTKSTDNSALRSPAEGAELRGQSQFDYHSLSSKDTDLRRRSIDSHRNARSMGPRDPESLDISHYCPGYLANSKCLDERTCNLRHCLPPVKCVEIKHKAVIAETVRKMTTDYEFWMNESFSGIVKELGSSDEKKILMSICQHLLDRDLKLQDKTKLREYSRQWELVAQALCDCGLSPSKAVQQIVCNVLTSRDQNYDVIDNVVEALYNKFIKGQSRLWSALQKLAKMESYEMPAHILIEMLKDAINHWEPQVHGEICDYLLSTPSPRLWDPKPEDATDNEIRNLVYKFIQIYKLENEEAAGKLADYLKLDISDGSYNKGNVINQNRIRRGGRFRLQSEMPKFERRSNRRSPRGSGKNVDKGSPLNAHLRNMAAKISMPEVRTGESTGSAQEEEVTSSTGEIACVPAAQANQVVEGGPVVQNVCGGGNVVVGDVPPARKASQIKPFQDIHITVKGGDRRFLCPASEPPSDTPEASSQNPTSHSENSVAMDVCSSSIPLSGLPGASSLQSTNRSENVVSRGNTTRLAAPNQRMENLDIRQMIAKKLFARAATAIAGWVLNKDIINPGILAIRESLFLFDTEDTIKNFKILLQAVCAHADERKTGISPKSIMADVGLAIVACFSEQKMFTEADKVLTILNEKVDLNQVEVNSLSEAGVKLLSAVVYLPNKKIKEVLQIVTDNNFTSSPDKWKCRSRPDDHELRDILCSNLLDQCRAWDCFLPQVELLYRSMLAAKDSYSVLDVGERLDNIICSFTRAGLGKDALNLMLWTSKEHNLMPKSEASKRILLTQINVMSNEDQFKYSPHMLCLLNEEPYNEALPKSVEGLSRVEVVLQSIWFACEVRSILSFLLHCHLANVPDIQQLPGVTVRIKVVPLPPATRIKDYPIGLRAVEPSLAAMQQRVCGVLQQLKLISPKACFSNGSIDLDPVLVKEYITRRRRDCRPDDPPQTSQGGSAHLVDQSYSRQDSCPNQADQAIVNQDFNPVQVDPSFLNQGSYQNQMDQDSYHYQAGPNYLSRDGYFNQVDQAFYQGGYSYQMVDGWEGLPHGAMPGHGNASMAVGNWQQLPLNDGGYGSHGGWEPHMPSHGPQGSGYERAYHYEQGQTNWPRGGRGRGRGRGRGGGGRGNRFC